MDDQTLREPLTVEMVWLFISEGFNASEIAAYSRITKAAAHTWMARAHREFSSPKVEPLSLHKAAGAVTA